HADLRTFVAQLLQLEKSCADLLGFGEAAGFHRRQHRHGQARRDAYGARGKPADAKTAPMVYRGTLPHAADYPFDAAALHELAEVLIDERILAQNGVFDTT